MLRDTSALLLLPMLLLLHPVLLQLKFGHIVKKATPALFFREENKCFSNLKPSTAVVVAASFSGLLLLFFFPFDIRSSSSSSILVAVFVIDVRLRIVVAIAANKIKSLLSKYTAKCGCGLKTIKKE